MNKNAQPAASASEQAETNSQASASLPKQTQTPLATENCFAFIYRGKFGVQQVFVTGDDFHSTNAKCLAYCKEHRLRFIALTNMFFSLEKPPKETKAYGQPDNLPIGE